MVDGKGVAGVEIVGVKGSVGVERADVRDVSAGGVVPGSESVLLVSDNRRPMIVLSSPPTLA